MRNGVNPRGPLKGNHKHDGSQRLFPHSLLSASKLLRSPGGACQIVPPRSGYNEADCSRHRHKFGIMILQSRLGRHEMMAGTKRF